MFDAEIAKKVHFRTETDIPVAKKGGTGRSHIIFEMRNVNFDN
jgi:hypothetical protein